MKALHFVQCAGAANPPATPGKLGGTTKAKARYSFDYPETWVEEVISKVLIRPILKFAGFKIFDLSNIVCGLCSQSRRTRWFCFRQRTVV